ncbi:MAG: hypothetical protein AB1797_02455 [bacterium]
MQKTCKLFIVSVFVGAALCAPAKGDSLLIDAATGVTWGDFTVEDVTADVETTYFNPAVSLEYSFGEDKNFTFAVGVGYSQSGNDFVGEWDGSEGKHSKGEVTVDRNIFDLYGRFWASPNFNLRFGYRYFKYEFSDGLLEKTQYGTLIEKAENAEATGDLRKGLDLEANFIGGKDIYVRLGLGYSYFIDAEYDWEYERTKYPGDQKDRNEGSATHTAHGVRIVPEVAVKLADNLRLCLDYRLAASIWEGTTDQADIEDCPGVDIYSAFGVGIEYLFPLGKR